MPNRRKFEFYKSGCYLVVGMSKKKRNFAWSIYNGLIKAGKKVYAIHQEEGEYKGVFFYNNLERLPEKIDAAIISMNLKKNQGSLAELSRAGIKNIWFQQGSYDKSVLEKTKALGIDPITGCSVMYMPDAAFMHRLHRFFHELISKGQN